MSRSGSGQYTQPLPDVIAGQLIYADWANTTVEDIGDEITNSLSRTGLGGMLAPLRLLDGTVGAPSLSFTNEPTTGIYLQAAGYLRISMGGADILGFITGSQIKAYEPIQFATAGDGVGFNNAGTVATGAATLGQAIGYYEEGTWTPNLWDTTGSSSEGQTYSQNTGYFTRIGNRVFFDGEITLTSKGTLTSGGEARIGPLPYAATAGLNYTGAVTLTHRAGLSVFTLIEPIYGQVAASNNYFTLKALVDPSGESTLTINAFSGTATFGFSGSYMVD